MTQLARKLRITDYFSLGWGTMVGVGWLVVMDDWLTRGGPHGASFSAACQLLHGMDDDAGLLHRLPMGSRRRRTDRSLYFPCARFNRTVSRCRKGRVLTASGNRSGPDWLADVAELSRRPAERDLSKLDNLRNAGTVCRFCWNRCYAR